MGKRILFFTYYECDPEKGGTERSTSILAKDLTEHHDCICFGAFKRHRKLNSATPFFSTTYHIPTKSIDTICDVLEECTPDIVIIQGVTTMVKPFRRAIANSKRNIGLIYAHHFAPGAFEDIYIHPNELFKDAIHQHSIKKALMLAFYPISKPLYKKFSRKQYKEVSENADKVVLLSPSHKKHWIELGAGLRFADRITCIHNALVFGRYSSKEEISLKSKRVLIVGRMHEGSKRISHALKIWNNVCHDPDLAEWQLDIVGDGRDRGAYEYTAKKLNLKNINFLGFQKPLEFYKTSSIFMMTSKFEGFAMTLLEACQTGTVPMAYNSFSSLKDIIDDRKNGIIIPDEDIQTYSSELKKLMTDDQMRKRMALASVEKSKEFRIDIIVKRWKELFEEVLSKNKAHYGNHD